MKRRRRWGSRSRPPKSGGPTLGRGCASKSLDGNRQPLCKRRLAKVHYLRSRSRLVASSGRHVSCPGAAVFRHDVGKTHASRRIWDSDEVLASRALNLAAGKLGLALQRLIAVGTVKFEFVRIHSLYLYKRNGWGKSMSSSPYFLTTKPA